MRLTWFDPFSNIILYMLVLCSFDGLRETWISEELGMRSEELMNVNLPAANLRYLAVCDYIYIKLVRAAWSDKLLFFSLSSNNAMTSPHCHRERFAPEICMANFRSETPHS